MDYNEKILDEQGYIICRNFIDSAIIHRLKNNAKFIFERQFQKFNYNIGHTENHFKENMIKLFNDHNEVFINCGKIIQQGLIELYELAVNWKLKDTLEFEIGIKYPLLCTRPVLYFNHPKLAKEEIYYKTPKHQDWPSMEASQNSLVVWIPLVDVNKENGSIILYPGSHKQGILPNKIVSGFATVNYDGSSIQPDLKVGDICIFSTKLVHESGEIFDDSIRWSAQFRYTDMLEQDFIERGYPSPYEYKPKTKL